MIRTKTKSGTFPMASYYWNSFALIRNSSVRIKTIYLAKICAKSYSFVISLFEICFRFSVVFAYLKLNPKRSLRISLITIKRSVSSRSYAPRTIIPRTSLHGCNRSVCKKTDPSIYSSAYRFMVPVVLIIVRANFSKHLSAICIVIVRLNITFERIIITASVMKTNSNWYAGRSSLVPTRLLLVKLYKI